MNIGQWYFKQGTNSRNLNNRWTTWIAYRVASQDIANNKSVVEVRVLVCTTSTAQDWWSSGSPITVTIDGTKVFDATIESNTSTEYGTPALRGWTYGPDSGMVPVGVASENITEASKLTHSKTVTHNADGTKTITASFSGTVNAGGYGPNNIAASVTFALPTIPRAQLRPKVSGTWRTPKSVYVKVSGTWRQAKQAFVKVGGVWRPTL